MSVIKCNLCKTKPFKVPYDKIGVALMKEHLKKEHNEVIK